MDDISAYIDRARSQHKSDDQIKKNLLTSGWDEDVINNALKSETDNLTVPLPPQSKSNESKALAPSNAWDTFEHILLFISLYVMASSITLILNFFVDKWFPSVALTQYYASFTQDSWQITLFRGYLAALIVSLPLYSFFFLDITKRTMSNPGIRGLHFRKILIYLTLVITFVIMLIGVISVVYNLLSGNVTLNFILHLIVILGITGLIFAYYLNQVKEDRKLHA